MLLYICGDAFMKNVIYTIGYTAFNIIDFVKVLKKYDIKCLIDVRSTPKSNYYKDFDDTNIKNTLSTNNIIYRNYKKEFGARQDDMNFYCNGYLDFEKFSKSQQFNEGIEKIKKAQEMGYGVCLMCAEKDPINCHRTVLIGRNLDKKGFKVEHILADETTCTQKNIDNRLLNKYFPNRNQLSIFGSDNLSDEENLEIAYKMKNKEIGFRLEEE